MTRRIPDDAFEYYVSLGPRRSYQAVADRFEVTKRAVTKHAVRDGWSKRLTKIEKAVRAKNDEEIADALGEMRERHLKTLKVMHARALTALRQFPLNSGMEAMRAAEMVVKLERLITGEPSERHAMRVEEVTRTELDRWGIVAEVRIDASDPE